MSRKIDISDPTKLSDEDKAYLKARNRLPKGVEAPEVDPAAAGVGPMTKTVPLNPNRPGSQPAEETETDYEKWNVTQLKEELEKRDLPVSGNKPELVERLQESDLSSEEEDEDDEDEDGDEDEDNEEN